MRAARPAERPSRLSGLPARLGGSALRMAVNALLGVPSCATEGEPADGAPLGAEHPRIVTRIAPSVRPWTFIACPPGCLPSMAECSIAIGHRPSPLGNRRGALPVHLVGHILLQARNCVTIPTATGI